MKKIIVIYKNNNFKVKGFASDNTEAQKILKKEDFTKIKKVLYIEG